MKGLFTYLTLILLLLSCDSEDAGNCFQTAGSITSYEITLSTFDKIIIHEKIELTIKEAPTQKVTLETGENLRNDIVVEVVNGQLIATNNNNCNFVRDYGITKLSIESPNITEIRNSSELTIYSEGVISYPSLQLLSEDYESDYLNVGDFDLSIDNQSLQVVSNGISNFRIKGITSQLSVFIAAGDARFEGQNLLATHVQITNKGTNDILVNPIEKITGDIYSLGNVISFNNPAEVNVTEHYTGKLIFE